MMERGGGGREEEQVNVIEEVEKLAKIKRIARPGAFMKESVKVGS